MDKMQQTAASSRSSKTYFIKICKLTFNTDKGMKVQNGSKFIKLGCVLNHN
jgi:hypothetical protein